MQKKLIYIFQNSFWAKFVKTSGGDVRFASMFRLIQDRFSSESVIFVNGEGALFDKGYGLKLKFLLTPIFFDKFGVFLSYCLRTLLAISKLFFLPRPDIFYSLSDFFPDTIAPFLFKAKNVRWIQVIHHLYLPPGQRTGNKFRNLLVFSLQKFSLLLIRNKADKVIVVSQFLKNQLIKLGFEQERIFVSSNGIDLKYFETLEDEKKEFDAVYLGRLTEVKGAFDLIRVWKKVVPLWPNARLCVIGGCDEGTLKKIKMLIQEFGLEDHIVLSGFLENDEAFRTFKKSRLFLFPSHEEGWGIVIAEAMACRLPVLSWDLEVYQEIFEDLIVKIKENDIETCAKMVAYYLGNENECQDKAARAYQFIKKYDWPKVAINEWFLITS
jgi:glycosyltransferase involved in cell wall biosynthesis